MAIPISKDDLGFNPDGGLVELDLDLPKKLLYDSMVAEFKRHVPNQPDFFIAKKKWQLLAEGACLTPSGIKKNWVNQQHEGYEVFAFVFCVAFGKLDSHGGCPAHLESSTPNPTMAYFRIRTILQKKGAIDDFIADTENIAYVDLATALNNPQADSLKFISQMRTKQERNAKKKQIDEEVYLLKESLEEKWKDQQKIGDIIGDIQRKQRETIPGGFQNTGHDFIIIAKEGSIFKKDRIWGIFERQELAKSKGSNISLAFGAIRDINVVGPAVKISFVFKINPEFATEGIACPVPSVCL